MPYYMYVTLEPDNKISVFSMDAETGELMPKADVPVAGGPSGLAISPDRTVLYAARRRSKEISSFRIEQGTGGLTECGTVSMEARIQRSERVEAIFLSTDRTGRYLLSSYYWDAHVAVHPLGNNGELGAPPIEWLSTAIGAHEIQTDPSNRFAFVPHIARLADNVAAPINENEGGANAIFQFRFDEKTGRLAPNAPLRVDPTERIGPRVGCFHPKLDVLYFSNEQGCSVTGYRLDTSNGTLSAFQTLTTLPAGYSGRNACSQIQISSSGKFLYVPNRGHNSIAGFSVDPATGRLTAIGQVPTEAVPNAFGLDPQGRFLFAAGSETGNVASYRINGDAGTLASLKTYSVGNRPGWVLITKL